MKTAAVLFLFSLASLIHAQTVPSHDEIFTALYGSHYNRTTKLATWHCPQEEAIAPDKCMFVGDSTAEINLEQMILINNDGQWKAFVAASAVGRLPDCHECAPLIALGVFVFRDNRWQLESKNDGTFRWGAWSKPASLELVKIGPKLYGFMFTNYDGNGGYFATYADLWVPEGKMIREVWRSILDEDNKGGYDPTGKYGSEQRVHVDTAYRFLPADNTDYYLLQIISRGNGDGEKGVYHSRSGISTYRFLNGHYQQVGTGKQAKKGIKR